MIGDIAHVCNRGVEKRKVFLNTKDYSRFVENLYFLNNQKGKLITERKDAFNTPELLPKQDKLVEILKWTLMPNHYHLLLYEVVEGGILEFTKRVGNAYTKYFNIKNQGRSGYLFQNSAKIIRLQEDAHFLYIPFYIDLNPKKGFLKTANNKKFFESLINYKWSSLKDFYGNSVHSPIIDPELFYEIFKHNPESYKKELLDLAGRGVGEDTKL